MAKSSKKFVWLILVVLLLVAAQLSVIAYVLVRTFSPTIAMQVPPQPQPQRNWQSFPPPVTRPLNSSQPGKKITAVKTKPAGPRAEPPQFSKTGGVYTATFNVEIKSKVTNAVIRFTTDGSEPTINSPAYSAPVPIRQSTLLRAVCFAPGLAPSIAATEAYNLVEDDLAAFSSNLPIIIINSFNQQLSYTDFAPMSARFIDLSGKRAWITNATADFDGWVDVKRRGYTSLRFPKMSLTVKTRDDEGDKAKAPIFGLPSESDWVLYAPYVDKTLIRDALGYELSNQMGRYAPRTRFVEVYFHRYGAKLSERDYAGVYMLTEKIKRDKNRVNIAKLGTNDNAEPNITGGYILKRDHGAMNGSGGRGFGGRGGFGGGGGFGGPPRASDDGVGFITSHGLHLFYVDPKEEELTEAQRNWVNRYFNEFDRALYGANFADPTNGYAKYLDVDAFIDHFWLVELSKNVDGFRYSAFLHKPRGGKITMGPAWDWNLSFGNADYYDGYETSGWYYENLRDTEISWIYRLRQDPEFAQRLADRWAELRQGVWATEKILARVDEMRTQLQEAQVRNFQKWPVMGRSIKPNYYVGPTYDAEINWMKVWIRDRLTWIDRQFPAAPKLSEKSGRLAAGSKISLTAPGEIFYTLDGTDPRSARGAKSPTAQKYNGPIVANGETKLVARSKTGNSWSGPVRGSFEVEKPARAPAAN